MNAQAFTPTAKFLHWSVAGLIVAQYVLAKLAEYAEAKGEIVNQLALLANHKSVGMSILALAVVRLIFRLSHKPPALHILLYVFLFALPLTGWLMSSAKAYSVSWFNLIALPDLIQPSEIMAERLHTTHHYLSEALFVVACIHIAAALKHHFIDKDDVLKRMADTRNWILFTLITGCTVLAFGRIFSDVAQPSSVNESIAEAQNSSFSLSALPVWNIDYNKSYIQFRGDQAGAPFSGTWQTWQANIQFDTAQLEQARFDVRITPASVSSNDDERDDYIRSSDFFDIANFPEARYRASKFVKSKNGGYTALGQLTMKGFDHDAPLNFTVTEGDQTLVLDGSAIVDRLIWNIGSGDWADTAWVGQEVMVEVRVVANLEENGS